MPALFVSLLSSLWLHPFYLSIMQLDYRPQSQSVEIALKVFTDDLETALQARGVAAPALGQPEQAEGAPAALAAYLRESIQLEVNVSPLFCGTWGRSRSKT